MGARSVITKHEYQNFVSEFQPQRDGLEVLGLTDSAINERCIEEAYILLEHSGADLGIELAEGFPNANEYNAAIDRFSAQWQVVLNEAGWLARDGAISVLGGLNKMQKDKEMPISSRYNLSNDLAAVSLDWAMHHLMVLPDVLRAVEQHINQQADLARIAHVVWSVLWTHPDIIARMHPLPLFQRGQRNRGKVMASCLSVMTARLDIVRRSHPDDCGMVEVLFRKALRTWIHNEQLASANVLQMAVAQGLTKLFGGNADN